MDVGVAISDVTYRRITWDCLIIHSSRMGKAE